ncbi:hypothetical protein [Pseudomonas cremoricolorata]|uniref:Lipoprotein n=1 Tax=Pseudomonas cremoricolorata TaxID=157783 RepID=A0A089Y7E3_9PSED|nr:hypothetical protein [Pseudomonas cremoricolorata]AIR87763.1 hypothetical protein LK03_00275 [Pseudomonas cremoricolorata]
MRAKVAAILMVGLLIAGCSDPKQAKLPANMAEWSEDQGLKDALSKLSDGEKKLFIGYATRLALASAFGGNKAVSEMTIDDALKSQQAWLDEKAAEQEKQRLLTEQVEQQQLAALKEMNATLTVSLVELKLNPKDYEQRKYSDYFTISLAFKNNTSEALAGVKGTVVLKDMFGDIIKRIRLADDVQIDAGQNYLYQGTMDFNQFKDSDTKLASSNAAKLQFEWEPDTYIFVNGKKQIMPN